MDKSYQTPVHSVARLHSYNEAKTCPMGTMHLSHCSECDFVYNDQFVQDHMNYSESYEETQGYSNTFKAFRTKQIEHLTSMYDLYNKTIVEIGCGKGEFLCEICHRGNNTGFGFDPTFDSSRINSSIFNTVHFIKDYFKPEYNIPKADFVACIMTLEHIKNPQRFLMQMLNDIPSTQETIYFIQVPNFSNILLTNAFWDIYYEHCSYFTSSSLKYLFELCDLECKEINEVYDNQYITIVGRKKEAFCEDDYGSPHRKNKKVSNRQKSISLKDMTSQINRWNNVLHKYKEQNLRVVIWGGGSKAVSFLNSLSHSSSKSVEFVVDINPHKWGSYIAHTGQKIISPNDLTTYAPDKIIIMNPIYQEEIENYLIQINLNTEVVLL